MKNYRQPKQSASLLVAAVGLLVAACSGSDWESSEGLEVGTVQDEIIGGNVATPGAVPYQAQVRLDGNRHCGGSLIAPDWVLTAAHCVRGQATARLTVVMGEHDITVNDGNEQTGTVDRFVVHPGYGGANTGNDIALIRLTTPFTLGPRVQLSRLALDGDGPNLGARVAGWGQTTSAGGTTNVLREATVQTRTNQQCNDAPNLSRDLFATELCAGELNGAVGACHGDSGGPLSIQRASGTWEQVGVVSWGQGGRCGTYSVYTRVSSHINWIRQHVLDAAVFPALVMPVLN